MEESNTFVKAGSLIEICSGEYSDFTVNGFFVALESFDVRTEYEAFANCDGSPTRTFRGYRAGDPPRVVLDVIEFTPYLIRRGLLLEIERQVMWYPNCLDGTLVYNSIAIGDE